MAEHGFQIPNPELIDDCVHCGFCLPSCPTYILWGEEMDSPRGRIHLMKAGSEGKADLTPTVVQHFDNCLGCMACMTACPSGVQYNKLIESTRAEIEQTYPRTTQESLFRDLIFALFPHPKRLRLLAPLLLLYKQSGLDKWIQRPNILSKLPPRIEALSNLAPNITLRDLRRKIARRTKAEGTRRARVGLLLGCVQRIFFSGVNAATVRVLSAEGCDVYAPEEQGCCGALALHVGREEEAKANARKLIDTFEREKLDYVVVNAAGCGSSMKEYGWLLRDDPQYAEHAARFAASVRDVTELLAELGPVAPRARMEGKVAYHDACHLAHAQGIRKQPRDVLTSIPGIELLPIAEGDVCCGSAGVYNLLEPEPASKLGERKAHNVIDTGATIVASANPGCSLQIAAHASKLGTELTILHPAQILDIAIRRGRKSRELKAKARNKSSEGQKYPK